jgi:DNA-binding NtrC family response regulator
MTTGKKTVLVVDDDREMTTILQKVLVRENYDVLTAENGDEAVKLMKSRPAEVVIADWKMPVCDGMRLIEVLRKGFPSARIIMITAFGEVDTYIDAMSRGAFEFLSKPLNIDELKTLVGRAMAGGEPPRAAAL